MLSKITIRISIIATANNRASKGILPTAPHRTVREPLDSYGSSRCVFQLISGAYTPMSKLAGLHFVQRIQPLTTFAQTHSFVPLAPFFKSSIHKLPKDVQVSFDKMAGSVLPATYQCICQICNHIKTSRSGVKFHAAYLIQYSFPG